MGLFSQNNNSDSGHYLDGFLYGSDYSIDSEQLSFEELDKEEKVSSDEHTLFDKIFAEFVDNVSEEEIKAKIIPETENQTESKDEDIISNIVLSEAMPQPKRPETPSLISRVMPFMIDENGVRFTDEEKPLYTLDSVDDIINSFEKKADIRISGLYSSKKPAPSPTKESPVASKELLQELSKKMDNVRKNVSNDEKIEMFGADANEIKNYQSSIGDTRIISGVAFGKNVNSASEATRQFNIYDEAENRSAGNDDSSETKSIIINDIPKPSKNYSQLSYEQSDEYDDIIDDLNGYTDFKDARQFAITYLKKKRNSFFALSVDIVIAIALTILNLPFFKIFDQQIALGIINLVLVSLLCVANFSTLKSITSLFKGNFSSELPFALSVLTAFAVSVSNLFSGNYSSSLLTAVAAVGFVFNGIGKLLSASYVYNNFRRIATPHEKFAFSYIKGDAANRVAADAVDGEAQIGIKKRCINILGFVRNSEFNDAAAKIISISTAVSLVFALPIALISGFIVKNSDFIYVLSAALLLGCPPCATLVSILPLKKVSSSLNKYGAQIPGYKNAANIEKINAVTVSSSMLFPNGTIELINMKVLGNTSVDKTLINAASVALMMDSPLAPVLCNIATTGREDLPECDSYKYEERMGISGWVKDTNILIGNRTLLEAHGIKAAPIEVDKHILKNGAFPVYIASNGSPEVMLIIRYVPNSTIRYELVKAYNTGLTILVNNCDPNISSSMISDYFGLSEDFVKILTPSAANITEKIAVFENSVVADASFRGDIKGLLAIATASIKLKSLLPILCTVNALLQFASIAAFAVLMFTGILAVTPWMIFAYQIISSLIIITVSAVCKI